ncbi:pro-FMRFamide-related neuropeptide VF [Gymnodraco acuticeps]|uniref:Pro-FMRFamide-related neuropeptide VF n=1 Tax=Gymnodraco acuticeps TaxID=8218 RepID=A0A6P8VZN4_GYMAC|nr:pro-FMRFamide-related neuropeptide VF [Gymnodraco acuticeps]
MSPAVNMLTVVLLLMLGASDLQVHGTFINRDKTLLSSDYGRHSVRKQQQTKSDIRKSLDLESYKVHVNPTTSRISLPTIIKLHPPTAIPFHLHANMPMRFGRENLPGDEITNLPQRFGRSWDLCAECREVREAQLPQRFGRSWDLCAECREVREAQLPQRFGRGSPFWGLLRTMTKAQIFNGLQWAEVFDFTTSSEELEMQGKTFKGMKGGLTSQHQGLYNL